MAEGPSVLQLLGPSTGGIRRHVVELTTRLEDRGWAVAVAGPSGVLDGLRVLDHCVEVPSGLRPGAVVAARRALRVAVGGVDLIHAHGLKAGWLGATLSLRPRLVVTAHNVALPGAASMVAPALARMEAALPGRVDAMVAVSAEMARRFAGVAGAGRITVIAPVAPHPCPTTPMADVRASWGVAPDQPLVVSVGRLHPQKDHATLISAAALLARRRPGVRFVIVGEGPRAGDLARQVRSLGLDDVVALVGAGVAGTDALAAADVVALASCWEGWPLVVAEAVRLGRPVVATAVGGIPEMLVDGVSGWLVAPGAPSALAGALEAALADPLRAAGRTEAARADLDRRYDPDTLVAAVESVYRGVLEQA
jgi:glycosyltransferase involved in cell wall biosynthesis